MSPEITVVIAVRDQAAIVGGLLQALDDQSLPRERFEVIVVDDASRDETPGVLERWAAQGPGMRSVLRGGGRGPSHARNLGIAAARGAWIAFTDGDTMPEPDWLGAALAAVVRERTEVIEGAVAPWPAGAVGPFTHQVSTDGGGRFMTANMIYSKALLSRLGGFDERFKDAFLEDSDLAFRALEIGVAIPFAPDVRVRHLVLTPSPAAILRSARKARWFALFAAKHGRRYHESLRPVARPLTSVDIDVLLGLLALAGIPRARGVARAALLAGGFNGLRRGLGGRLADATGIELVTRVGLSFALPVARAYWWAEGCVRFRTLVW